MMATQASLADRYRAHGKAFALSLELGCTPKEAELEIARRIARAQHEQNISRLRAKTAAPAPAARSEPQPPCPQWWQKD